MVFPIARLPKAIPHRAVFFHFGRAIEPKQRFWLLLTDGLTSLEIFREEKDLAVGMCGFRSGIYGESLPLAAFTWQKRFASKTHSLAEAPQMNMFWGIDGHPRLTTFWRQQSRQCQHLEKSRAVNGCTRILVFKAPPNQFSMCVAAPGHVWYPVSKKHEGLSRTNVNTLYAPRWIDLSECRLRKTSSHGQYTDVSRTCGDNADHWADGMNISWLLTSRIFQTF